MGFHVSADCRLRHAFEPSVETELLSSAGKYGESWTARVGSLKCFVGIPEE
jgi:hypothetical protein